MLTRSKRQRHRTRRRLDTVRLALVEEGQQAIDEPVHTVRCLDHRRSLASLIGRKIARRSRVSVCTNLDVVRLYVLMFVAELGNHMHCYCGPMTSL